MVHRTVTISRKVTRTECLSPKRGKTVAVETVISPSTAGALIVIAPGFGAGTEGEDPELNNSHPSRYREIAEALRVEVGGVVRMANRHQPFFRYEEQIVNDLAAVAKHAISHATDISGRRDPPLYMMGYSAGAGAVAVVARRYRTKKILLVAPSGDAGAELITEKLGQFEGTVDIVVGEEDEVVTPAAGKLFDEISPKAAKKRVVFVPGCDHFFSSNEADAVFRKAPFWAFSDNPTYSELM